MAGKGGTDGNGLGQPSADQNAIPELAFKTF